MSFFLHIKQKYRKGSTKSMLKLLEMWHSWHENMYYQREMGELLKKDGAGSRHPVPEIYALGSSLRSQVTEEGSPNMTPDQWQCNTI